MGGGGEHHVAPIVLGKRCHRDGARQHMLMHRMGILMSVEPFVAECVWCTVAVIMLLLLQDGDVVPKTPYYHQSLWHNLVLLATWGIPNIKLAFIDPVSTKYQQQQHGRTLLSSLSETQTLCGVL